MSSQVKHCTAYMITLIVLLYHTAGLFSSGGCCSLQPTAQPVTEQVSSSVKSESEWKWARMLDISDCVLTLAGDLILISCVFCSSEEIVPSSSISMLSLCCGCCKPNRENSETDPELCEWDTAGEGGQRAWHVSAVLMNFTWIYISKLLYLYIRLLNWCHARGHVLRILKII